MSGRLSPTLADQLALVPKSTDGYVEYAPCQVRLHSGAVLDRVYVVEEVQFRRLWGSTSAPIAINDIALISDSPFRLPSTLADKLYAAGESGMGYTVFVARMRNGARLPFVVGNAVDFPNWPPGVDPRDVSDVEPHAGRSEFRDRPPGRYETSADYGWCVFGA